jgi:hypothetical protein
MDGVESTEPAIGSLSHGPDDASEGDDSSGVVLLILIALCSVCSQSSQQEEWRETIATRGSGEGEDGLRGFDVVLDHMTQHLRPERGARSREYGGDDPDPFFAFPGARAIFKMLSSLLDVFLDSDLSLGPGGERHGEQWRWGRVRNDSLLDLSVILLESHLQASESGQRQDRQERERDRETETERETERDRERDRQRDTERHRERQTECHTWMK